MSQLYDFTTSLQQALISRLQGDATLMNQLAGLYDLPPEEAATPYLAMGDASLQDRSTAAQPIAEITLELQCWSDYAGRAELLAIGAQVETLLTRDALQPLLPQGRLISLRLTRSALPAGEYGRPQRAILRVQAWMEPSAV